MESSFTHAVTAVGNALPLTETTSPKSSVSSSHSVKSNVTPATEAFLSDTVSTVALVARAPVTVPSLALILSDAVPSSNE